MTKKEKKIIRRLKKDIEKALDWNGKGYSEGFLSGYQKAYEQVKNDLKKL